MENSLAKSLGYESEEDLQDGVMLNSEDLNQRYAEAVEKERQLAKEEARVEWEKEQADKEVRGKDTPDETKDKDETPAEQPTDTGEVSALKKQVEEMSERLSKIDKYSSTAKSQADETVGKVDT
jgi:hypothetical protein